MKNISICTIGIFIIVLSGMGLAISQCKVTNSASDFRIGSYIEMSYFDADF